MILVIIRFNNLVLIVVFSTENQVQFIINKYHIYLRATGRISMSGVNERNVYYIATAMHEAVTTISN